MAKKKKIEEIEETEPELSPEERKAQRKKAIFKEILFYVGVIAVAFVLWRFILLNAQIPTGSMENTIPSESRVLGLRCAYWFSDPDRGDVIIFYGPDKPDTLFVKRVIGLPGETVTISDGKTFIDGEPIQEDYLPEEMKGTFGPYEVPDGAYFVMGDNRNHSGDARAWSNTYVYESDIVGEALFTYWPKLSWID